MAHFLGRKLKSLKFRGWNQHRSILTLGSGNRICCCNWWSLNHQNRGLGYIYIFVCIYIYINVQCVFRKPKAQMVIIQTPMFCAFECRAQLFGSSLTCRCGLRMHPEYQPWVQDLGVFEFRVSVLGVPAFSTLSFGDLDLSLNVKHQIVGLQISGGGLSV